ncbi:30S ribosomal protein S15 [Hibiscus syriacus]|uniref:Small ribosomal subunit protein uS15c n=1 Tax=Hibiscus syriacus TaxID=106335 RepID=A0A6A3C6X8_HIBSY|nr:30S ribosomal protein S15 [Hibiscus syriacus]
MAVNLTRSKHGSLANPSLLRLFSTSSNGPNNGNAAANGDYSADNPSSVSSYFGNAGANQQQQKQRPGIATSKPVFTSASFNEIRKNLSEYRRSSAVPPAESSPTHSKSPPLFSFQESYRKNFLAKRGESNESSDGLAPSGKVSFDFIKNSLKQMKPDPGANNVGRKQGSSLSLSEYKNTLRLNPSDDKRVSTTEFVKTYGYEELGQKLNQLRPPKKEGEGGFSLQELKERLMKLREIEEKEDEARNSGLSFHDLKESLRTLKMSEDEKRKNVHHNMSSGEKMKIELAKVRDEFKMSESDCGSARVQVATLTTKIKHLSSVLHKKDKHSRKGLLAMVQKRKKLLKYLRRTDWDSYCLTLSKLGLRDTADSKNLNRVR